MLDAIDWVATVGEAEHGLAAIELIERLTPKIVFLDIAMPGISGIEVLRRIQQRPLVIFTTAYAEHAVAAFELGAIDYLLKPFGEERLSAAHQRVRAAVGEPRIPAADRLGEALSPGPISRLFLRNGRSILPLAVADIRWCEAVGDHVEVHAGSAPHLLHLSLNRLQARLYPAHFARIHRTHLVNLDQVAAFGRQPSGALNAVLRDGTVLAVSRAKAQELRGLAR